MKPIAGIIGLAAILLAFYSAYNIYNAYKQGAKETALSATLWMLAGAVIAAISLSYSMGYL